MNDSLDLDGMAFLTRSTSWGDPGFKQTNRTVASCSRSLPTALWVEANLEIDLEIELTG